MAVSRDQTTPKRLIVNADDFGYSPSVNAGVVASHRDGILTSATIMANAAAFDEAAEAAKSHPELGVGVHLNIVRGPPLSAPGAIPTLVGANGCFRAFRWRFPSQRFLADAEREYRAQIEKILAAGIAPTHCDFEKHHGWQRGVYRLACRLALEYGIRAVRNLAEPVWWSLAALGWPGTGRCAMSVLLRSGVAATVRPDGIKAPDRLLGQLHIGGMDETAWLRLLANPPPGTSEVMTHPGLPEPSAAVDKRMGRHRLASTRAAEMSALTSRAVREQAEKANVLFVSYRALADS